MKRITVLFLIPLLFGFLGCVAKQKHWVSIPEIQINTNDYFEAQFQPVRDEHNFFDAFELIVKNKTSENLEIDWKKTRYLHNNRDEGGFVFKGLDADNVNNPPPDIIAPKTTLSKRICPAKLITWAPIRERIPGEGISCGVIPTGQNSISLVIRQNNKELNEIISLKVNVLEK